MKIVVVTQFWGKRWRFIPETPSKSHDYVPKGQLINHEADEDESWELDDLDIPCFSFCIPVKDDMHSPNGCIVRQESYRVYINALSKMAKIWSK